MVRPGNDCGVRYDDMSLIWMHVHSRIYHGNSMLYVMPHPLISMPRHHYYFIYHDLTFLSHDSLMSGCSLSKIKV